MSTPEPFELLILALGGFRLVRLIGWDTITEPLRKWLTGYSDDGAPALGETEYDPSTGDPLRHGRWRVYVSALIRCPWCQGLYVAAGLYAAWCALPGPVLAVCVPLALSALFGLIAKNLDP